MNLKPDNQFCSSHSINDVILKIMEKEPIDDQFNVDFFAALVEICQLAAINESMDCLHLPSYNDMLRELKEKLLVELDSPEKAYDALVEFRKKHTGIEYRKGVVNGHFELLTISSSILLFETMIKLKIECFSDLLSSFYERNITPPSSDISYFFRNPNQLFRLKEQLKHKIVNTENEISQHKLEEDFRYALIMSAGTNNGLEAYSSSVIIKEATDELVSSNQLKGDLADQWKQNSIVYGVDNNFCILLFAALNKYDYDHINPKNNIEASERYQKYFEKIDDTGTYQFKPGQVKDRVRFGYLDLRNFNPELINGFDAIYMVVPNISLDERCPGSVYDRFQRALKEDGYIYAQGKVIKKEHH